MVRVKHPTLHGVAARTPPEFWVTFHLRNACFIPFDDHYTRFRGSFIQLRKDAQPPLEAVIHGFTEYTQGYQRLSGVRTAGTKSDDDAVLATCERRPRAIGIPFSCNNIYHQSFHAIPAYERWKSKATGDDVDFLPLIYPSAAVGKKMSLDPLKWHAWEFSVRPFTRLSYDVLAKRTAHVLHTPCTCYDEVYGNADAFNPIARTAVTRLLRFRQASLQMLPPPATIGGDSADLEAATALSQDQPSNRILWIGRRHKLRNIANEAQLAERLEQQEPRLWKRMQRTILEGMGLAQQMRLLATSAGLFAVHGQAMAWVLFLPTSQQRCAAVEIFPQGLANPIYRDLSAVIGVHYESLTARASCASGKMDTATRLQCNVTVGVEKTVDTLRRAAKWLNGKAEA